MYITQKKRFHGVALMTMLSAALLTGCDQDEQTVYSADDQADMGQQGQERPLEHVAEFDSFTLKASLTPTDRLPDSMIEQYGIEADPDRLLLNAMIFDTRSDGQREATSGDVNVKYENLTGHDTEIDMREVEANDMVSYIGTLDASGQLVFRFAIDAQPEGSDETLETDFEVQLPPRDVN